MTVQLGLVGVYLKTLFIRSLIEWPVDYGDAGGRRFEHPAPGRFAAALFLPGNVHGSGSQCAVFGSLFTAVGDQAAVALEVVIEFLKKTSLRKINQ